MAKPWRAFNRDRTRGARDLLTWIMVRGRPGATLYPADEQPLDETGHGAPDMTPPADRSQAYECTPLAAEECDRAFAIAHLYQPALTLEGWTRFVRARLTGSAASASGIMALRADSYLRGLFCYRTEEGLMGPALAVDHVMVPDFFDHHLVCRILLENVTAIADREACETIRMALPPACMQTELSPRTPSHWDSAQFFLSEPEPMIAALHRLGFEPSGIQVHRLGLTRRGAVPTAH
jgi:hypothetical protein